ncbi:MAG: DNA methyltransferase, partial [Chitinophagales bacterium]
MALFQNSVLNKHLNNLDDKEIEKAYEAFRSYFHDADIQENIRQSKEEQFQEGFLRELFVKILGYTLNPHKDYNLTTELKNEKGAKKTDGAILKDGKALAVIELKGTDTKDLDKVNDQAFSYKNHHSECVYVITSNFEKLRFFIHNAVEHIEFDLFHLTQDQFKVLWLCLQVDNILEGIPLKANKESILKEEQITKQLYKDYSSFKHQIWQNICKNSPELDQLLLFKKSQKLLDRFLFIFFAEDSGLLPPNSIFRMVERYDKLIELDAYKPLYEIFKQYFGYINTGRKGKARQDDIFEYNGGLFRKDEILDNIQIDDEVLKPHVLRLTEYDFQSEVDVNILGHIFENSLNEIENVTAELEGQEIDKSKTKRKKDGVFYTPKYITKYIVKNTVGRLCEEKKAELEIEDEQYAKGRRNRDKKVVKKLDAKLQQYRKWLLGITICDPACGSGAFLNQALEFLIAEHQFIDTLETQLLGYDFEFPGVEAKILEHNIFGVDINDESIEIAKLSLWLRTAQRGRKLTSLSNNIKCGNSLIDDPEVAGEKAFNWQKEFPNIFKQKELEAFHIVLTTHNSRVSERMRQNNIKAGPPVNLSLGEEIALTEIFREIITENNYRCIAYNICKDHVHMVLVCEEEALIGMVQQLKSVSSKEFNRLDHPIPPMG